MNAETRALWHRHWIDSWGGLLVASLLTISLGLGFALAVLTKTNSDFSRANELAQSLAPLSIAADTRAVTVWFTHALFTAIASFSLILFIHGTGIRSNDLNAAHPSIYFNLTLPVSRTRMVVTRFLATALWALALMGAMLLLDLGVAGLTNLPVPGLEMAQTTLLALLLLITVTWILDAMAIVSELWSYSLIPIAILTIVIFRWSEVFSLVADPSDSLMRFLALIAVAAAALTAAVIAAHKRDF